MRRGTRRRRRRGAARRRANYIDLRHCCRRRFLLTGHDPRTVRVRRVRAQDMHRQAGAGSVAREHGGEFLVCEDEAGEGLEG